MTKKEAQNNTFLIPPEVSYVTKTLEKGGFEAYLIGGCVRDLLLRKKPKDWDVTTNATPDQIQAVFPETFYENTFGTVGVKTKVIHETDKEESGAVAPDPTLEVVEVTPYRTEAEYSDNRRPDAVTFAKNLSDDIKRRDFTINALALKIEPLAGDSTGLVHKGHLTDLYKGQEDLMAKIIRTVGSADERFGEDALRMLRAVRFAAELGFEIHSDTKKAISQNAALLKNISQERIRDEFVKIISSDQPMIGLQIAHDLGILKYIVPELEEGIGTEQNKAHAFDVWEHLVRSVQHGADKKFSLRVRLAAIFHDIGKPKSRRKDPATGQWTFYGHEVIGARMTEKILARLKFPKKLSDDVLKLVRWHMFFSDTEQISLSAVRRMVANVGTDMVWDLMNVRECDRIGTGRPKANPYRLRKYKAMIEMVMRDPVSVGMLKIDGKRLMGVTSMAPGPRVGFILHALLEDVLEDPKLNTAEYLEKRALDLIKLSDEELRKLGEQAKLRKKEEEEKELKDITDKYHVE
jgi:poly(A) polymerase/tRNA nucleotidyltransferase (CCA-adding enzyme)